VGAAGGGAGGAIALRAGDSDSSADSDVTVTGDLVSRGGAATTAGAGGAGGTVTVRSDGVLTTPFPTESTQQVIAGGGDLSLQNVDTRGGTGTQSGGGAGGNVRIETTDGAIDADDITTSGGKGDTTGGRAGSIVILTRDATGDNANASIDVGVLTAVGGEGTTGAGGAGAFIDVRTQASQRVVQTNPPTDPLADPPVVLQEVQGGGSVTIASADASGGKGGTIGGSAGVASPSSPLAIRVTAAGAGNDLTIGTLSSFGTLSAHGGDGQGGNGGAGRNVVLTAEDGDLRVGAIDTSGGAGHNAATPNSALGGGGGSVTLSAGSAEDASPRDITLGGQIDATEGASEAAVTTAIDGGAVTLDASGSIEHAGVADPQITTGGDVSLTAGTNIGDQGQIQIKGGEEASDDLTVSAGGHADVRVTNLGFRGLVKAVATSTGAVIDIQQVGTIADDAIHMAPSGADMLVSSVDTRASGADAEVRLDNPVEDSTDDGKLVLATGTATTGSVLAGGSFTARSDGTLELGNGGGTVITASADNLVLLEADFDEDGTGALLGAPGAEIDLAGAELALLAGQGIGTAAQPIVTRGGGSIAAINAPLKPDADEFIPNPNDDTGIFLRNTGSGDLQIVSGSAALGIQIAAGTGEIVIENFAGGITVESALRAKPLDNEDGTSNGTGGDVTLRAPGSQIVLDVSRFTNALAIGSGGAQLYDGEVVVARNTEVEADGGVTINGGLDTRDTAASPVGFTATLGDEATDVTTFSVSGGIGDTRALGTFAIRAPDGGDVALNTPLVHTTGSQTYSADLDLAQFTTFDAGTQIRFDKAGEQTVTGPAGFSLGTGGVPISPEATIAKANGNLTLESTGGSILIGDGEKLSVAGSLALSGDTVRFTDLSALDISVTSPDAQVFARAPAAVATPSGATIQDGGTDLVANTVAFSSTPTVVGGGPAPRIATVSGTAQNAGALPVGTLTVPISAADLVRGSRVFDLAIPAIDPGHETQEIPTTALEPALEPQPSRDRAGPGAPVSREEVAAFFACAPVGAEAMPAGCTAAPAPPAYGSALDTERAVEVARAYRELLGDSASAAAGRAALARAAADPRAEVGSATSPAGRVYLTEVARVLGQVRLLGLGDRYGEVRADLLAAVAAAIGSPQLDAARLGAAVDARAMGMPI
jgi:hypothetical protein